MTVFQFHKGTIKTNKENRLLTSDLHFNSIKVRLKQSGKENRCYRTIFQFHKGTIKTRDDDDMLARQRIFQFHKGTIKTRCPAGHPRPLCPFQFHKGTIKTYDEIKQMRGDLNFNSIKVRLKLSYSSLTKRKNAFQFHKGTIKTLASKAVGETNQYFNSIKVRLKLCLAPNWRHFFSISIP